MGNDAAPTSVAFPYSPVWRALAFFVPAAIFAFAILRLIAHSREANAFDDLYVVVALACAAVTVGPHLFIAAALSGSLRIGDDGVTRTWFGRRHTLAWSRILEVRDFLNQIQVIPARESDTIYVQFYHNLVRPVTFHKTLIQFARKYEVNLMLRPTTRRFLPVRWRQLVLLALIIGTGLVVFTVGMFRTDVQMRAMVVGLLAGCTYTTVSAAIWMTVSKSHKRIRAQALVFYALYWATLLLPLLVLGVRQIEQPDARQLTNPVIYGLAYVFAYLFGFFSGSGLLGLFYPNRDLEPRDHAIEVLGGQA
jgi:hypothetical protein